MNKRFLLPIAIAATMLLPSCGGGGSYTVPTSNTEKVQTAFNGVESSLRNASGSRGVKKKSLIADPSADTIATIFAAMKSEAGGPEIEYNDTPLIQFQYLKALYEEIGNAFSFNTKYTNRLNGEIFYDFTADEEAKGEAYRQQYQFDFSALINIDANDLITASVGFDITFTHDSVVRRECMYAELILDYDMKEANPTFTFTMRDVTDCLEFPVAEERLATVEYDYVRVDKGQIQELRKFCVSSPESLTDFDRDGFVYKYAALRGYKEGKRYKISDPYIKNQKLRDAVIGGLGLDKALEGYPTFFALQGQEQAKIKTVVDRFNGIYGKDFVYHLATSGADEEWESPHGPEQHNRFLMLFQGDQSADFPFFEQDFAFSSLFEKSDDPKDKTKNFTIRLLQDDYELLETYDDISQLLVKARSDDYDKTEWVELVTGEERFSDLLAASGFLYNEDGWMNLSFDISLKDDPTVKLVNANEVYVSNSDLCKSIAASWPLNYLSAYAFMPDAIPVFEGENVYFSPRFDYAEQGLNGRSGSIACYGATSAEAEAYANKLKSLGFAEIVNGFGGYVEKYVKRMNDDVILELKVEYSSKESGCGIMFSFVDKPALTATLSEAIDALWGNDDAKAPEYPTDIEYEIARGYEDENRFRLIGATSDEAAAYIRLFEGNGFMIHSCGGNPAALLYADKVFYFIMANGNELEVHKTPCVFSFVGSMNGWDITNKEYELETFLGMDENKGLYCFSRRVTFQDGDSFKIVLNHDWAQGEFNYDTIMPDPGQEKEMQNIQPESDYRNIQIIEGKTYDVNVFFTFGGSDSLVLRALPCQLTLAAA